MATQGRNIAQSVNEVIQAFDKAVNLVRRIEDRKDVKQDSQAIHDLYQSLALGGQVMRNYFEADSKRLGQAYVQGDGQARAQILDTLIGLKDLVSNLQTIYIDEGELDAVALKESFDVHRLEAGMCLSQLSLRLTAASNMNMNTYAGSPPAYMSGIPSPHGLQYSSSPSTTYSSSSGRPMMPLTPEPAVPVEQMYKLNFGPNGMQQWQKAMMTKADLDRTMSNSSSGSGNFRRRRSTETSIAQDGQIQSWTNNSVFKEMDPEDLAVRRRSSHTLSAADTALLSPALPDKNMGYNLPGQEDTVRDSYTSFTLADGSKSVLARQSNTSSRPSYLSTTSTTRDHYDPDDFSPIMNGQRAPSSLGPLYVESNAARQSGTSYALRAFDSNHSTLEHAYDLDHFRENMTPQPLRYPGLEPSTTRSNVPTGNTSAPRHPQTRGPPPSQSFKGPDRNQYLYQLPASLPNSFAAPVPVRANSKVPMIPHMSPQRNAAQPHLPPRSTSRPGPPVPPPQTALPTPPVMNGPSLHLFPRPPQVAQQPQQPQQHPTVTSSFQKSTSPAPVPITASPTLQTPATIVRSNTNGSGAAPASVRSAHSNLSQALSLKAPNVPLTLPTEKSFQPFCRGAFRLFIGLKKKAFDAANRPLGYHGMVAYWRCERCMYEGQMAYTSSLDPKKKGKQEKIFDPTIREHNGIRYKWEFLAKCHVQLKSNPETAVGAKRDGSFGGFACMFCAAEGHARGWEKAAPLKPVDTRSVKSSGSSKAADEFSASAPTFGNLQSFMDHLQMHREEAAWPCEEMRGRMKCIVGREAEKTEDWDINLTPPFSELSG